MIDRTPQKTFLKSPAVRVQTPKQGNQNSPRVKRLLSFMELDNDLEDNLVDEEPEPMESPTVVAKPVRRKGLTQQSRSKPPVFEEPELQEGMGMEDDGVDDDDDDPRGFGMGDESYGQYEEQGDELQDDVDEQSDEEEIYGKPPTPPVKQTKSTVKASKPVKKSKGPHSKPHAYEEEQYDEDEELVDHQYNYNHQYEEEEEEEDIY